MIVESALETTARRCSCLTCHIFNPAGCEQLVALGWLLPRKLHSKSGRVWKAYCATKGERAPSFALLVHRPGISQQDLRGRGQLIKKFPTNLQAFRLLVGLKNQADQEISYKPFGFRLLVGLEK